MQCPLCSTRITIPAVTSGKVEPCAVCGAALRIDAFPRILHGVPLGQTPEPLSAEGEASCYIHLGNRAATPCSCCGRYMCTLCQLEIDGRHLCPACLEGGFADSERLVHERTLWGPIAVSMSILPVLIFYFTVITAPATLVLAFIKRRAPTSLVRRSRFNLWFGASFAALQVLGWITLFAFLVRTMLER